MSIKTCNTCSTSKSIESFGNDKSKSDGKSTQCKDCKKQYRLKNLEKLSEDRKSYYKLNAEKEKTYRKKYSEKNSEKVKATIRSWAIRNSEHVKLYRTKNAHKYNSTCAKYRSTKLIATPNWFEKEKHLVEKVYLEAKKRGLQVDHIIPLQSDLVCGLHTWANLQLLDRSLNVSKGNRCWPDHPEH